MKKFAQKNRQKNFIFMQILGQEKVGIGTTKKCFLVFLFVVLKLEGGVAEKQKGQHFC